MGCKQQIGLSCFAWLLLSFIACQPKTEIDESSVEHGPSRSGHFQIKSVEDFQVIEVNTPFVNGGFTERYLLYERGTEPPVMDSITEYIPVPIQSAAITSTTHVGYFQALDAYEFISASNNIELVYDSAFHKRVANGQIQSLGVRNISQENLISSEVDLIFAYAIDVAGYEEIKHWRELGQQVVLISEFMEQDPLRKANWIQPISMLLGKERQAEKHMAQIAKAYDSLKQIAQGYAEHPDVLMGFPWKGTWYMSGGKSFQAQLFEDAGANYLWSESSKESGMPLSVEEVLHKGLEADYWLNVNAMKSLTEIAKTDARFTGFTAFTSGQVYNNNKRLNAQAGNDYWESGVVRPDLILSDLIQILHPQVGTAANLYYYQKLSE